MHEAAMLLHADPVWREEEAKMQANPMTYLRELREKREKTNAAD